MMAGLLDEERIEYAVGAFGGERDSYYPTKNTPDVIAFLNVRPFGEVEEESPLWFLRELNVGGSTDYGDKNNPANPAALRTSAEASSTTIQTTGSAYNAANPAFLAFNNNVYERGTRSLWELHAAYYYKSLSLMGAWDSGIESWAVGSSGPRPVRVPVNGYFVQAAYLLTGETRVEPGVIDPLRRFDLRPGRFGLGAFEPVVRYSELYVGREVFTAGLSDPNLWSNEARQVDVGMNWYLNKFVKVYIDWEYTMYGQPVLYAPEKLSNRLSMFWARLQFAF